MSATPIYRNVQNRIRDKNHNLWWKKKSCKLWNETHKYRTSIIKNASSSRCIIDTMQNVGSSCCRIKHWQWICYPHRLTYNKSQEKNSFRERKNHQQSSEGDIIDLCNCNSHEMYEWYKKCTTNCFTISSCLLAIRIVLLRTWAISQASCVFSLKFSNRAEWFKVNRSLQFDYISYWDQSMHCTHSWDQEQCDRCRSDQWVGGQMCRCHTVDSLPWLDCSGSHCCQHPPVSLRRWSWLWIFRPPPPPQHLAERLPPWAPSNQHSTREPAVLVVVP